MQPDPSYSPNIGPNAALKPEVIAGQPAAADMAQLAFELAGQVPDSDAAQVDRLNRVGVFLADSEGSGAFSAASRLNSAQRMLEAGQLSGMGEEGRRLAVSLNQSQQSLEGTAPLSLEDTLQAMSTRIRSDRHSPDPGVSQEANQLGKLVISVRTGATVANTTALLQILERNLAEFAANPDDTPLYRQQVNEWRNQRDAIWRERTEAQAKEAAEAREEAERPAHDAAVEAAQANVAKAFDAAEQAVADQAPGRREPTATELRIGQSLVGITQVLRDNIASRFRGFNSLPLSQQEKLADALQELHNQSVFSREDPRQRNEALRQGLDSLTRRYQSGELFKD
ncbi:MAG TPA: hypothetical protein VF261_00265 [Candidatus Saccharimonadales bacterium]